jgi:Domain of unknown function (DUF4406)
MVNNWLKGFDFSKTYYLSGPMAGYEELNFPAFDEAAEDLRAAGISIISPAEIAIDKVDPTDEDYLANDFAVMASQCEGIILLQGWPASKGARAELEIALTLKWPVYYYENYVLIDMNGEKNVSGRVVPTEEREVREADVNTS